MTTKLHTFTGMPEKGCMIAENIPDFKCASTLGIISGVVKGILVRNMLISEVNNEASKSMQIVPSMVPDITLNSNFLAKLGRAITAGARKKSGNTNQNIDSENDQQKPRANSPLSDSLFSLIIIHTDSERY